MISTTMREIRNHKDSRYLPDVVQSLLLAEFMQPSDEIFLVSPWVTDLHVINNTAGQFSAFFPTWECRNIRFSEVLSAYAERGTQIYVALRDDPVNTPFLKLFQGIPSPICDHIHIRRAATLHEKGLLTRHFYLSGSFNFTLSGITMNEEIARLELAPSLIAETHIILSKRWKEGA